MRIHTRKAVKDTNTFFLPGFEPTDNLASTSPGIDQLLGSIGPAKSVQVHPIAQAASKVASQIIQPTIIEAPVAISAIEALTLSDTPEQDIAANKTWPHFNADAGVPPSGEVERLQRNVDILRLSKQLDREQRPPTPQEAEFMLSFTGWGSLARVFAGGHEGKSLGKLHDELRAILTEKEWASARASTPNAHYTDPGISRALWAIVKQLGFKGGRVLEPTAGTGLILAAMPRDIALRSDIAAVEIDSVAGTVLRQVYEPHGVRVQICGIETARLPKGRADLVISNVPFMNVKVPDTSKSDYADWTIHNYLFGKAIDLVRPGGLVVFITSSHTMDGNLAVRKWLDVHAELIEAIRLPKGAFSRQARTEVVADIIVLRKRATPKFNAASQWATAATKAPVEMLIPGQSLMMPGYPNIELRRDLNPWFIKNRSRVLGQLKLESGQYGGGEKMHLNPVFSGTDEQLHAHLLDLAATLPSDVYTEASGESGHLVRAAAAVTKVLPTCDAKPGAFVLHGGCLCISEGSEAWLDVDELYAGKVRERVLGFIQVRDAARALIDYQRDNATDDRLKPLQQTLNAAYDSYVQRHGYLFEKMNVRAFRNDPDCPLVLSLEHYDPDTETARKADMFSRRTVNQRKLAARADNVKDAMLLSLAEHGRIELKDMAQRMRKTTDFVVRQLAEQGLAFKDPSNGRWVEADAYLCGNIREKLIEAEAAGSAFINNVKALEASLPKPLLPGEIQARLGAPWIPTKVIKDFIIETLELKEAKDVEVTYTATGAVWSVNAGHSRDYLGSQALRAVKWGTPERSFATLVEAALNQQPPMVTTTVNGKSVPDRRATMAAREKFEAIREHFRNWAWSNDERATELASIYNNTFNQIVQRKWDGSHLTLPGLSDVYEPYPHQLNAIWRIITSGNTLLAHMVGAGKTLTMIAASMEMRRLGKAAKPLHVVQNNMLEQYAAEFMRCYPTANVLIASKDDLKGDRRRQFASRVAGGDWDAVIMTMASFERLACRPETVQEFVDQMLSKAQLALNLASDSQSKRSIKEMEKRLKTIEAKVAKAISAPDKDSVVHFDDLGIDGFFIDEGHLWKSSLKISKMPRIAGLPTNFSNRALDLTVKIFALERTLGRRQENICMATATCITNSIGELFAMQQYLQPETLEKLGLAEFDAWAATFGETVTGMELAPDGSGYRLSSRFAKFVNVPELMSIFRMVADVQTEAMLKLPTPKVAGGKPKVVVSPRTPLLQEFTESLVKRADKVRSRSVKPDEDNMLKITHEGRMAALDMRLIYPDAVVGDDSKLAMVRREVMRIHKATAHRRGTQIVFCDLSTPKKVGFSVYNQLREDLIAAGMPAQEIAFVHDYETDKAKEQLFKQVRAGSVRVLMGSTSKLGTGTNVQDLLVGLHHVDVPWRPSDIVQRDGRAIRVGNTWPEVELVRYCTEASFDAFGWNLLTVKSRFIEQIMAGESTLREVADVSVSALTCAEITAIASGNPLVLEKATIDAEVQRLSVLRDIWNQDQWRIKSQVRNNAARVDWFKSNMPKLRQDAQLAARAESEGIAFVPAKGSIADAASERVTLVERIGAACLKASQLSVSMGDLRIGSLGGFELNLRRYDRASKSIELVLPNSGDKKMLDDPLVSDVVANGRSVVAMIAEVGQSVQLAERTVTSLEESNTALQAQLSSEFDRQERLLELVARQVAISAELDLDKDEAGTAGLSEATEEVETQAVEA